MYSRTNIVTLTRNILFNFYVIVVVLKYCDSSHLMQAYLLHKFDYTCLWNLRIKEVNKVRPIFLLLEWRRKCHCVDVVIQFNKIAGNMIPSGWSYYQIYIYTNTTNKTLWFLWSLLNRLYKNIIFGNHKCL